MSYPGTWAATAPDRHAVVMADTGRTVSYRELDRRSSRLARLLSARGLRPGETVALLAENHERYLEVYWAAVRSGLYLTAVNSHLSPEEAAWLVTDSAAKALVTTKACGWTAAGLLALAPDCRVRYMIDGVEDGFESYEAAVAECSPAPPADQPRGDVMLYSSGTTGRPKGIRRPLTGRQIDDGTSSGLASLARFVVGIDETSRYLCPAPLYHSAGIQWSSAVQELGGTVVVMAKFDPERLLEVIERERITHVQVVPTMLIRLLKLPAAVRRRYDLSSLRSVLHAAAPCPVDVKRQMIDWVGPILDEYYAGTEGIGFTFISSDDWLAHPGSVGRPLVGILHVCGPDGAELPTGGIGAVYVERDSPPFSYHNDPVKTSQAGHPDHPTWWTVGDIGYVDEDGYLYLTDRAGFMIISGGVNIYPAEIESCLVMHPKVADVAVFGLPDDEMGQYVHAVVEPAAGVAGGPALTEELRAYARAHLAGYKVPRQVDYRAELPRMPTGKLAKGPLRDEYLPVAR